MQIVSNLHEMSNPVFWEKYEKCCLLKSLPRVLSVQRESEKGRACLQNFLFDGRSSPWKLPYLP